MRKATQADLNHMMDELLALKEYSPAPQVQYAEPEVARAYLAAAIERGEVWFTGGYAAVVQVGSDWYSSKRYLIELIILKVYPWQGGRVEDAIKLLDDIADLYSCVAIAVGDTQVGYMTPKYIAAGYTTLGTQLIKEIRRGESSPTDRGQRAD
jgi:hypothetical protein